MIGSNMLLVAKASAMKAAELNDATKAGHQNFNQRKSVSICNGKVLKTALASEMATR